MAGGGSLFETRDSDGGHTGGITTWLLRCTPAATSGRAYRCAPSAPTIVTSAGSVWSAARMPLRGAEGAHLHPCTLIVTRAGSVWSAARMPLRGAGGAYLYPCTLIVTRAGSVWSVAHMPCAPSPTATATKGGPRPNNANTRPGATRLRTWAASVFPPRPCDAARQAGAAHLDLLHAARHGWAGSRVREGNRRRGGDGVAMGEQRRAFNKSSFKYG